MISVIPGIAALLGVIVLAWVQANDQNNQQTEIDNICTSVSVANILILFTISYYYVDDKNTIYTTSIVFS